MSILVGSVLADYLNETLKGLNSTLNIKINMFNRITMPITINNNYTVEDGGILIVDTTEETAGAIAKGLLQEKRNQQSVSAEPQPTESSCQ